MALRMRIVHIEAEGDEAIATAMQELAALVTGRPPAPAIAAPVVRELPAAPVPDPAPAPAPAAVRSRRVKPARPATPAKRKYDADVLAALAFRPLRLSEIADSLCADKRDVGRMTVRLYGVLQRLQREGRVERNGKLWALTAKGRAR